MVEKGATIGVNATIDCGVTIGAHAFIGAGSVITEDVSAFALVVGNPGKQIGWMSAHGDRLHFDSQGVARGLKGDRYRLEDNKVLALDV